MDDRAVLYKKGTTSYAFIELTFNGNGELASGKYGSTPTDYKADDGTGTASEDSSNDGIFTVSNTPVLPGSIYIAKIDSTNVNWNDDGAGNIVNLDTGEIVGSISYDDGKITIPEEAGGATSTMHLDYKQYSNTTSSTDITDLSKIETEGIDYSNNKSRYLNTGATNGTITENFKNLTQLSSDFIFYAEQNGSGKGDLMSTSVTEDGVLKATYTNGQVKDIARLAVATFKDKEILVRKGNNLYLPNQQTFTPIIVPGGVISKIRSGMLEMSNVDISQEFINLITAQRAYQANAKTITTTDQILQTTMNIKR